MKQLIYSTLYVFLLAGCQSRMKSGEESKGMKDDANSNLSGEYEYFAGAVGDGYLYYKILIRQAGDSVRGTIFSGIYLSKNDQGFYTMPAATITYDLTGKPDGKDAIIYLGKVLDSTRMEYTYQFPAVPSLFSEDAQGDPVQSFYKLDNALRIVMEEDTLDFTSIRK